MKDEILREAVKADLARHGLEREESFVHDEVIRLKRALRILDQAGFVAAPKEPTEEMISAFYVTVGEMSESESRTIDLLENGAERIYRAMLATLQEKSK